MNTEMRLKHAELLLGSITCLEHKRRVAAQTPSNCLIMLFDARPIPLCLLHMALYEFTDLQTGISERKSRPCDVRQMERRVSLLTVTFGGSKDGVVLLLLSDRMVWLPLAVQTRVGLRTCTALWRSIKHGAKPRNIPVISKGRTLLKRRIFAHECIL